MSISAIWIYILVIILPTLRLQSCRQSQSRQVGGYSYQYQYQYQYQLAGGSRVANDSLREHFKQIFFYVFEKFQNSGHLHPPLPCLRISNKLLLKTCTFQNLSFSFENRVYLGKLGKLANLTFTLFAK